jgi:hypothetical protein
MMNVLQIQDDLKNFSEDQLIKEMQQPSGSAPQFLVLSELNRRKRVKGEFEARQAKNMPTVAEEAVASAGVPQSGMMGMSEAMAPASVESGGIGSMMPKTMKMGGEVDSYAEGGLIEGIADSVSQNAQALENIQQATLQNAKLLQDQQNTPATQPTQQPTPPLPSVVTTMPTRPFPTPRPPFGGGIAGIGGKGGPRTPQRPFNRMPMNRFGVPPQQNLGTMAARLGTGGLGFGQYARRAFGIAEPQSMAEGGVIRAQSGLPNEIEDTSFDSDFETQGGEQIIPTDENQKLNLTSDDNVLSIEQELLKRQKQLEDDRKFDRNMALAQLGLGILASDKPRLAQAIGEGGQQGLTAFTEANKRYQEGLTDVLNARSKLQQARIKAAGKGTLDRKGALAALSSYNNDIAAIRKQISDINEAAYNNPTDEQKVEIAGLMEELKRLRFEQSQLYDSAGIRPRPAVKVADLPSSTKSE